MYFLVSFEPTRERAIYQSVESAERLTVRHLLAWICRRFHFENSTGETGNRRLSLIYNNTELETHWFLEDINIRFGATVRCLVKEGTLVGKRHLGRARAPYHASHVGLGGIARAAFAATKRY